MKIDKKGKYKMVNSSDIWEATKSVMRVTNPLTAMMIDVAEKAVGKSSSISENGDIEEMKLEAMRQEISARMSEVQAKVAQELAIANRIDTAEEVTIEEFYDLSGESGIGLNAKQDSVNLGANGSGRKVTKRIYTFKGFRETEVKVIETAKESE